jgi:hypothetical protein
MLLKADASTIVQTWGVIPIRAEMKSGRALKSSHNTLEANE